MASIIPPGHVPTEFDILMGAGGPNNTHSGNIAFREILLSCRTEYKQIPSNNKKRKTDFIHFLHDQFKKDGYRFLQHDNQQCCYNIASRRSVHVRIRKILGGNSTTTTRNLQFRCVMIGASAALKITTLPVTPKPYELAPNIIGNVYRGQVKSFAFPDFLQLDGKAELAAKNFFNTLFCRPSRLPSETGDGICLTVDKIYQRWTMLNIHRPSYLRQAYGRDDPAKQTNNPNTVFRFTYGTGSGKLTAGTPPW